MILNEQFYDELREKIKPFFEEDGSHGFDHTQRVHNLVVELTKNEEADLEIVKVAALLHDIARKKQSEVEGLCHAEEGAKMAKIILEEMNFPEDKISKVIHAIEVHRYSKNLKPENKEAELLQDADRLDA